jgi:hypothetical protein
VQNARKMKRDMHSEVIRTVTNLQELQKALDLQRTGVEFKDTIILGDNFSLSITPKGCGANSLEFVKNQLLFRPLKLNNEVVWWSDESHLNLLFQILSSPICTVQSLELNNVPLGNYLPLLHPNPNLTSLEFYKTYLDGSLLVDLLTRSSVSVVHLKSFSLQNDIAFLENLQLCTNLEKLCLSNSLETPLVPFISLCTSITHLVANSTTVLGFIKVNSTLKTLDVGVWLESSLATIFSEFEHNNSIETFKIRYKDFYVDSFGDGFVKNTSLTSLTMCDTTSKCLCELLSGYNRIAELNVIIPENADHNLFFHFIQSTTTVQTLGLDNTDNEEYKHDFVAKFFSSLKTNASITYIRLEHFFINVESAVLMASMLQIRKLKGLDLSTSYIEKKAFPILFSALDTNTLKVLRFSFSRKKPNTELFEKYLWQTTSLETLTILEVNPKISERILTALMNNISADVSIRSDIAVTAKFKCLSQHNQGLIFFRKLILCSNSSQTRMA